jgi:UDP-N-acetylglucosamine 2-epimerase
VNPYGDGHSSARIIEALKRLPGKSTLLKKSFHLLEQGVP